jgi:aminoglycoside phosphotransferase (APT) family kinase protein
MLGLIETWLPTCRPALGLPPGPPLRFTLITGSVGARGKLIALGWQGTDPRPCLVVKWPRDPADNARLDSEFQVLRRLHAYTPPGPRRVPRPLAQAILAGRMVTVETAVPGSTWRAWSQAHPVRAGLPPQLAACAAWFAALAVRSAHPIPPAEFATHILRPLTQPDPRLEICPQEAVTLAHLAAQARQLAAHAPLVRVFSHNDAGPPNILVDGQGRFQGLIDWESGGWGLPTADLLYLLARGAAEAAPPSAGPAAIFWAVFGPPAPGRQGAPARQAQRWIRTYCRALHLDPAWVPVLLALTWMGHAANEAARAGPGPFRAQLAAYLDRPDDILGAGAPGTQ